MPITEFQKQNRRHYLGSSDAAAIVGVDPWKSSADVFIEKTQDLPERDVGEAALIGTLCEDAVLAWFSRETGKKIVRNQFRVHSNGVMAANLDALVVDGREIVEAKVIGIISQFDRSQWGEAGTDEIPEKYIIQGQHQLAVMGPEFETVWLPVLLGGVGFVKYRVRRNNDLIQNLETIETKFWNENVKALVPPPESVPHMETLRGMRRVPEKTVPVPPQLVQGWLDAKEAKKIADEREEKAKCAVIAALGNADSGDCGSFGALTFFEQERDAYEVKASKYRVLRHKKQKG